MEKFRYTMPVPYSIKTYQRQFITSVGTSEERPILFVECSYTKGSLLKHEQTLAYKVSKITNRTIYKRGMPAGGVQHILEQFESGTMKKNVPDAEYIIYTFIPDHINRLFKHQLVTLKTQINVRYKLIND